MKWYILSMLRQQEVDLMGIILYDRNKDVLLPDRPELFIIQHFRFLKKHLSITFEDLIELAVNCGALQPSDCSDISSTHQTIRMNSFWKQLLKKGQNSCRLIIQKLQETMATKHELILHKQTAREPPAIFISIDTLKENRSIFEAELDLSRGVEDMLLELGTISIEEHDQIDGVLERIAKRRKLMDILFQKKDLTWIPQFLQTLNETDHNRLIEYLQKSSTRGYRENKLQLPPRTFAIHLEGQEHDTGRFKGVQQDERDIEGAIGRMVDSQVLEIREGSIVIVVRTEHPEKMISFFNGSDENMTLTFLDTLFKSSTHLVDYFENECNVWEEEVDFPMKDVIVQTDACAGCFQQTVRDNFKALYDELEDDIMNETMEMAKKYERYEHSIQAIMQIRSRSEKAAKFMHFIFDKACVLLEFKKVFTKLSRLELEKSICKKCKAVSGETKKRFELKVGLNKTEKDGETHSFIVKKIPYHEMVNGSVLRRKKELPKKPVYIRVKSDITNKVREPTTILRRPYSYT